MNQRPRTFFVLALAVCSLLVLSGCDLLARVSIPRLAAGTTVSTGPSSEPVISADGEVAAFTSASTNLVANDTNGTDDVFVRRLKTGSVVRANVTVAGGESSGSAGEPAISADGRLVAFTSSAADLVAGDTNGVADVFVRDVDAGTTERISVTGAGAEASGPSGEPAISADGRYVAFTSSAADLVAGDTNGVADVFVRDRVAGTTVRASVTASGGQVTGASREPAISPSGDWVAFTSDAAGLVSGDDNGLADVFLALRSGGTIRRASAPDAVSRPFQESNGPSRHPSVSDPVGGYTGGGHPFVAYESDATNLAGTDGNGSGADVFVTTHVLGSVARTMRVSSGPGGGKAPSLAITDGGPGSIVAHVRGGGPGGDEVVATTLGSPISSVTPTHRVVSRSDRGASANGPAGEPAVTPDGRFVVFTSTAGNLAGAADDSNVGDVYVGRARGLTVSSVEPNRIGVGETRVLTVRGSGFDATSTVTFDAAVAVNHVAVVSSSELAVEVTGTGTVPGDPWRDVTVKVQGAGGTQGGLLSATCIDCVEIAAIVDQPGSVAVEIRGGTIDFGLTSLPVPGCTGGFCPALPATVSSDGELSFGVESLELDPIPLTIPLDVPLLGTIEVDIELVPAFVAPSGRVIPASGEMQLSLGVAVYLRAALLPSTCALGPIEAALSAGPGGDPEGVAYDQTTGEATLAGGLTQSVAITGCGLFTAALNSALGLPLEIGDSRVVIDVGLDPVLTGTALP